MFKSRRTIIEAAYRVYYRFWGKEIDESLRLVPDSKFKYLPKELIDSLLVKHLRYGEDVLLVREEYKVAYRELQLLENPEDALEPRSGGIIVTGQPGIGSYLMPTNIISADNSHNSIQENHFSSPTSCFFSWVHGRQLHFKLAFTFCFFKTPAFR